MKEYTIDIGGLPHTVLLDEEEAKVRGAEPVEAKQDLGPKNKAMTAPNKSGDN